MKPKYLYLFAALMFSLLLIMSYSASSYALSKWQTNYNKSLELLKSKKYGSALKEAQIALKENRNPYTLELTGNILQFLKKYNSSNRYFKEAVALFIAGAGKNSSKKAPDKKTADRFIKMVKNNIGLNYLFIGNNLLKKNNVKEAINTYKKGLTYASERHLSNMLMLNSAMGYENIDKFRPATLLADKVIANNPKNPFAYFVKGRAEYSLNELDASIADLNTAASIDPSNDLFKNALEMAKERKRETEQKNLNHIKHSAGSLFK